MLSKKKSKSKRYRYLIALGSNLGNRRDNLEKSLNLLEQHLQSLTLSSIYESPALLKRDAPSEWNISYLNMVISGYSEKEPVQILNILQKIEKILGKKQNKIRWAPRIIDLDILLVDNIIMNDFHCQIPHSEFLNRDFCLIPAAEIAANWPHPITLQTIISHANNLMEISCKKVNT